MKSDKYQIIYTNKSMFGIELSDMIISSCKNNNNYGYINNNFGKPFFSSSKTNSTVAIISIDPATDYLVPQNVREEMNANNFAFSLIGTDKDHAKNFLPDRYFENIQYENRIYVYGITDCYTLIRDYYRDRYQMWLPANIERSFGWWNSGQNLYVDMYQQYGFEQTTTNIKKDDVLIFKFNNSMPSHSAIYLGDGKILHHMLGRFSCVEQFDGIYKTSLAGVLRYVR